MMRPRWRQARAISAPSPIRRRSAIGWALPCSRTGASAMARSSRSSTACATSTCMRRSAIRCITTRRTRSFMPKDSAIQRVSPLADTALQGRFGADKGAPGVTLSMRHPMSIVTVIARKGQSAGLSKALEAAYQCPLPGIGESTGTDAISFHWCGADQYFAIAEGKAEGELYRELKSRLDGLASVSDQSHGRVILRVTGPKARTLLAKGT